MGDVQVAGRPKAKKKKMAFPKEKKATKIKAMKMPGTMSQLKGGTKLGPTPKSGKAKMVKMPNVEKALAPSSLAIPAQGMPSKRTASGVQGGLASLNSPKKN